MRKKSKPVLSNMDKNKTSYTLCFLLAILMVFIECGSNCPSKRDPFYSVPGDWQFSKTIYQLKNLTEAIYLRHSHSAVDWHLACCVSRVHTAFPHPYTWASQLGSGGSWASQLGNGGSWASQMGNGGSSSITLFFSGSSHVSPSASGFIVALRGQRDFYSWSVFNYVVLGQNVENIFYNFW